jgi:phospholipase C
MDNRREFLRKAALLTGTAGIANSLPASIQKAFAINPAAGSTYLDAEHVVFLMQENRSFDHCYGALQGVRGFNDPRAISLPNKNKVWAQSDASGNTYAPFRHDLKDSKITWLGSLPHGWNDMTAARNDGHYDNWLEAKKPGRKECEGMPLTMGYFDRRDIPFYYALADAFTVCDQHFCSSLTGTTPNRLHFWTGTIREKHDENVVANVYNSDVDYGKEASWKTFPEYLEDNQVSWKIYQNEVSMESGFEGEEDDWLGNFTDNPIEWFKQYKIRYAYGHRQFLPKAVQILPGKIKEQQDKIAALPAGDPALPRLKRQLEGLEKGYAYAQQAVKEYTQENFDRLSQREKNLHEKAFSDNRNDPDYHNLETITYEDGGTTRTMKLPKGDVLHQFRQDVKNGQLPTVSWVVAPSNFSDHPGSPWYGAWYLSEVMDILTQNPEVWKKTIFILNYDENDGYFDHVPPFVPPNPYKPNSGKVSNGIDCKEEYVSKTQDWMKNDPSKSNHLEGPIGLGYRVPLVIASPWTRGGWVNSEVCDLTSPIQFLEHFISHKTGKKIYSEEVTAFRRAICGDLTSVFRPYNGEKLEAPQSVERIPFLESIHKAQFKEMPTGFKKLGEAELAELNKDPMKSPLVPNQEKGTRPATAIPYQLYVNGKVSKDRFELEFQNRKDQFGDKTTGAGFIVYHPLTGEAPRNYVVSAGDKLADEWPLASSGSYHLCVHGANGFFREFKGTGSDPAIEALLAYEESKGSKKLSGNVVLMLRNGSAKSQVIEISDPSYKGATITKTLAAGKSLSVPVDLSKNHNWYDLIVRIKGNASFEQRFAGHVENGQPSLTDPLMGGVIA